MDQTEVKKQQSLSQFMKSQFHRKIAQLLLSVSVFSLFFSYSYWLSLLHYYFYFNFHGTLAFELFSHAIDKNCIFLLCNGLLVFLAKDSGLISSSSKYDLSDGESFKNYEDVPQSESIVLEPEAPLSEKEAAMESAKALKNSAMVEGREEEEFTLEEEEEEEENAAFVEEEDGEVEGSDDDLFAQDFEEEEVELVEGNRVLSTEELNKRFDEFIRKMKEELRVEARQQLVMVKGSS